MNMSVYRDFPHEELDRLHGVDLAGRDFSHFELAAANFSESICHGCSFEGAMLAWADFRDADLSGANFTAARLYEVDFRGANLDGAIFTRAIVSPVIARPEQFRNTIGFNQAEAEFHSA